MQSLFISLFERQLMASQPVNSNYGPSAIFPAVTVEKDGLRRLLKFFEEMTDSVLPSVGYAAKFDLQNRADRKVDERELRQMPV